jgi:hypothetical protein
MVSAISASRVSHWWRWEANHLSCNLRDLIQMISLRLELSCAMYADGNCLNMISLHGLTSSESVRLREMYTRSGDDS